MNPWTFALRSLACGLALWAVACGDDSGECTPSLDEWCEPYGCDDRRELQDALTGVLETSAGYNSARQCGDRVLVTFSTGFVAATYVYDPANGQLVGGARGSDGITDDACENQRMAAGEVASCDGESCLLLGSAPESTLHVDACDGPLAEPLIASCLAEPPPAIEGCEACACPACYPALLPASGPDSLVQVLAVQCLSDYCPDDCSAQIAAFQ